MKSIKEQLLELVDLQKIDLKIYTIKKEGSQLPSEIERLENEFKPQLDAFNQKKELLKAKEVENMEMQTTIKSKEALLKELQEKLYQVKNAKELNAVDAEIGITRKEISELEENSIKLMEVIDNLKKEISEQEQIIETEKKNLEEMRVELKKEESKNEEILSKMIAERQVIADKIDPELLKDYEFIAKKKDGIGIVAVKNGACTGCYMTLPPQVVHDIRKGLKVHHCRFCSRILFYPEWEN